jgi:hypothetical protein
MSDREEYEEPKAPWPTSLLVYSWGCEPHQKGCGSRPDDQNVTRATIWPLRG